MTQLSAQSSAFDVLAKLRQVLELLANIRNLAQPLSTPEGLQQALTSLIQLANLLGLDAVWTARVQSILEDPAVFNVVLSIVQYVLSRGSQLGPGVLSPSSPPTQTQAVAISAQMLSQWLPLIAEIIALIRQIRGEQ